MNSREAFEKWAIDTYTFTEGDLSYGTTEVKNAFEVWQASRKQLLKELSEKEPVAWMRVSHIAVAGLWEESISFNTIFDGYPLIIRPTEEE